MRSGEELGVYKRVGPFRERIGESDSEPTRVDENKGVEVDMLKVLGVAVGVLSWGVEGFGGGETVRNKKAEKEGEEEGEGEEDIDPPPPPPPPPPFTPAAAPE